MEGLARTLGRRERKLTVDGVEYTLATPRLGDWLALEIALAGTLPDPIELAAKAAAHVPANQLEAYWNAAYRSARESRKVDLDSLDKLPTMLGIAAQAYVALRRHHHGASETLESALEWLDAAQGEHGMPDVAAVLGGLLAPATPPEGESGNADAGPPTGPS
jgi:hypothetical protein